MPQRKLTKKGVKINRHATKKLNPKDFTEGNKLSKNKGKNRNN